MDTLNQPENIKIDNNELLTDAEAITVDKTEDELNTSSSDLKDLINNFNSGDDMSKMMDKFSKGDMGDIGNVFKQFTDIISSNSSSDSCNNKKTNDCSTEGDDSLCEEDDDFDFNLDKYFISENGKNLCDVLLDIKTELTDIKLSLNK